MSDCDKSEKEDSCITIYLTPSKAEEALTASSKAAEVERSEPQILASYQFANKIGNGKARFDIKEELIRDYMVADNPLSELRYAQIQLVLAMLALPVAVCSFCLCCAVLCTTVVNTKAADLAYCK